MKILVVENEIYLAQSIALKLEDAGFVCERAVTTKEALEFEDVDILLLSTSFSDYGFFELIKKHKDRVVILMVSYINADTVTKPMDAGALDYVLKPFMIEELIRKINHFCSYRKLTSENSSLQRYINSSFSDLECEEQAFDVKLPLLIKTNHQRCADSYAFHYAKHKKSSITFQSLAKSQAIPSAPKGSMLYLSGFETLKKSEKRALLDSTKKLSIIISTTDLNEDIDLGSFETTSIIYKGASVKDGELISIEDYVKLAILSNQGNYSDTELSRRLGISRKSLWEKRKKYGFYKNQ